MDSLVAVCGGTQHSVALTNRGHVYMWGSGAAQGMLANGQSIVRQQPQRVVFQFGASDRIIQICAAEEHTLFLTDQGHVYSQGSNGKTGVLGNDTLTDPNKAARRVKGMLTNEVVTMISTCRDSAACITADGNLYMWGKTSYSLIRANESVTTPTLVSTSGLAPPIFVASATNALFVLLTQKKLKRELASQPMSALLPTSKVASVLPPYPHLATLVGNDPQLYFHSASNAELLLDMSSICDGKRSQHWMKLEGYGHINDIKESRHSHESHDGIRIMPYHKLMAYVNVHYSPHNQAIISQNDKREPEPSSPATSPAEPATSSAPSVSSSARQLPVGLTMSVRVCSLEQLDADSPLSNAGGTVPMHGHGTLTHSHVTSPSPASHLSPTAVSVGGHMHSGSVDGTAHTSATADIVLLSLQLPAVYSGSMGAHTGFMQQQPRTLELTCDATLTRFSLTLFQADKFQFVINLDDARRKHKDRKVCAFPPARACSMRMSDYNLTI